MNFQHDNRIMDYFRETTSILVYECVSLNIKYYIQPNFHSLIVKDVRELLEMTFKGADITITNECLEEMIEEGIAFYYKHIAPPRSNGNTFVRIKPNFEKMNF